MTAIEIERVIAFYLLSFHFSYGEIIYTYDFLFNDVILRDVYPILYGILIIDFEPLPMKTICFHGDGIYIRSFDSSLIHLNQVLCITVGIIDNLEIIDTVSLCCAD